MPIESRYAAIVIGASAGGLNALVTLLRGMSEDFALPIIVVQHRGKEETSLLEEILQSKCRIKIKQADEKEEIKGKMVYLAPPDYHLLIEQDKTFSLSIDHAVNHSRPSIDVLFESAAHAYADKLVGIILSGANHDGANGMRVIHLNGGLTIAQNPDEAAFPEMPVASIRTGTIKHVLLLNEIKDFLIRISNLQYV